MSVAKASSPGLTADEELAATREALAEEMRRADTLNRIAAVIAASDGLEGVVQAVVDGGVELSGAAFGAFFYNVIDPNGESYTLYTLSGAPRSAFESFPMPRNTEVFAPTFAGAGVVRSDDITTDPRYGRNAPYTGMPQGHLPVRSYLAASVISLTGEVLGGLFFGHPAPGRFSERMARLMEGVAAQAAVAIDNVRLHQSARREVDERRRAEADETLARERLQFALEAGRLGAWELDLETLGYEASDLCKENYGHPADEPFTFDDLMAAIHPSDRDRMRAAIDEAIRTGAEYDIEYRNVTPAGEERWLHVRGRAAAPEGDGVVRRMAGVSLDVTERRRGEERQRLLLNELNHRVKNTLATVQSIATQTLRSATSAEGFREAFEARLMALSQTHNLLTEEKWAGTNLMAIVLFELRPHATADGAPRFRLESDRNIRLNPKAAVALGMAIHELATNALKYGALASPVGQVTVRWQVAEVQGEDHLILEWMETGGPPVVAPKRRGFGGRLLEQGLARELAGKVRLDYDPAGLTCRMELPLSVLEPEE